MEAQDEQTNLLVEEMHNLVVVQSTSTKYKNFKFIGGMSRTPHSRDPVESKITADRKEGSLYSKGPGTMGTKLNDEPIASLRRGAVM